MTLVRRTSNFLIFISGNYLICSELIQSDDHMVVDNTSINVNDVNGSHEVYMMATP
jgi:hypothetical protein